MDVRKNNIQLTAAVKIRWFNDYDDTEWYLCGKPVSTGCDTTHDKPSGH